MTFSGPARADLHPVFPGDRHDNIGMGKLGKETFKNFMQEKRLEHLAGYLETPGGPEMWKPEIAVLRKLAEK